jgi:S-layer like family, outer domain
MQNNLVMKIKKVAAIAGSAIMASSMMAPVMAATLANLPAPFITNGVFNANIVVGSSGTAAGISNDLAGAMDVAAAFAQQASATVSSSGSISLTRPMTPGRLNVSTSGYMGFGDTAMNYLFNNSVSGFEWMVNTTNVYNETDYVILENIEIASGGGVDLDNTGTFTIDFTGFIYKIMPNSSQTFPQGLTIPLFGTDYQIVDMPENNEVTFGVMTKEASQSFPSTITIPGKATVELLDFSSTGSQDVLIKVTAANGTIMFNDFMSKTGTKNYVDDGYLFTLSNLRTLSSGASTIDVEWSTSSIALVHNGNASVLDASLAKWKVGVSSQKNQLNNNGTLSYVTFTSPQYDLETEPITLTSGQNTEVMDYFNITFAGFDDLNSTSILVRNIVDGTFGTSFNFVNVWNDTSKTTYLGSYKQKGFGTNALTDFLRLITIEDTFRFRTLTNATGLQWVEVYNQSASVGTPTGILYNNTIGINGTTFTTSGATYQLNWSGTELNATLTGWTSGNNSVYPSGIGELNDLTPKFLKYASGAVYAMTASDAATLTLTEADVTGSTITVTYGNNSISKVEGSSLPSSPNKEIALGTTKYTDYGTSVSNAASGVNIVANDARRVANIWIGRSAMEETTVNVNEEIDGSGWTVAGSDVASAGGVTPIVPGIGASAAAYTSPVSLVKPTIIIGGGEANSLTAELAANEEGVTTATLLEATNKAYLELIENAFGGSQTVLVVAGRDAKDTKLACQALAAHVAGTRAMDLSANLVWLDTSASSYTSVSVVAEAAE